MQPTALDAFLKQPRLKPDCWAPELTDLCGSTRTRLIGSLQARAGTIPRGANSRMSVLLNPFFWFALALSGWALWRPGEMGWVGGVCPSGVVEAAPSGFSAAGLAGQEFYQPSARQVLEMQLREEMRPEVDDQAEPPQPGAPGPAKG